MVALVQAKARLREGSGTAVESAQKRLASAMGYLRIWTGPCLPGSWTSPRRQCKAVSTAGAGRPRRRSGWSRWLNRTRTASSPSWACPRRTKAPRRSGKTRPRQKADGVPSLERPRSRPCRLRQIRGQDPGTERKWPTTFPGWPRGWPLPL